MDRNIKIVLFLAITLAVGFGFEDALGMESREYSFVALHIFLFNLACGGSLILAQLSTRKPGIIEASFFAGGLAFALGSFFKSAPICILSAVILFAIAESVRWKKFSWFPSDFFRSVPASEKFEQASLLCLSMGLAICAAVLLNNQYLKWFYLRKLDLHVFFLGFSFPVSLIAFSLIFERLENGPFRPSRTASEYCFWTLNLGVIFFFIFIIFEIYVFQLAMALSLFSVVLLVIYLHLAHGERGPVWWLIFSALIFLTVGSVTGIGYVVVLWRFAEYEPGYLLSVHSVANVFGWNLTWMMLAVRQGDYPLQVSPRTLIPLHWALVLFVPLARTSLVLALCAICLCIGLLYLGFFSPPAPR